MTTHGDRRGKRRMGDLQIAVRLGTEEVGEARKNRSEKERQADNSTNWAAEGRQTTSRFADRRRTRGAHFESFAGPTCPGIAGASPVTSFVEQR